MYNHLYKINEAYIKIENFKEIDKHKIIVVDFNLSY